MRGDGDDAILTAAIRQHDVLYGQDHCDRKYILSCHKLPELILQTPRAVGADETTEEQP